MSKAYGKLGIHLNPKYLESLARKKITIDLNYFIDVNQFCLFVCLLYVPSQQLWS